jgi:LacI family transcriptional regulator
MRSDSDRRIRRGRHGITHLLSQGHRRIAFIGDDPHIYTYTAALRHRGYLAARADQRRRR